MGKARDNHTTPEQPPLDDNVRWTLLDNAVGLHERQTGHFGLAALDLVNDLKGGRVHGMRRNRITGERKHVFPSFWKEHFSESFSRHVVVFRRTDAESDTESTARYRIDDYGNIAADRLDDWVFYVWRPDFDRLYSAGSAQDEHELPQRAIDDAAVPATRPAGTRPKGHGPQVVRLQEVFLTVWPNGVPPRTTEQEVLAKVKPVYKERGWAYPKRDVIARALRRRQ